MTISTAFYKFLIGLLVVALTIALLTRGCSNTPPVAVSQNKAKTDSAAHLTDTANKYREQADRLMADTAQLRKAYQQRGDSLKAASRLISIANEQATVLANEVSNARTALDTQRYIHSCDSLALMVALTNAKFKSYLTDVQSTLRLCDSASLNNAQIIANLSAAADGYKAAGDVLRKQNSALSSLLNPKGKLYLGGEVAVLPGAAGVGPGLLYQDKQERLYGLSGGIATSGGWWMSGRVYFKIQLHK